LHLLCFSELRRFVFVCLCGALSFGQFSSGPLEPPSTSEIKAVIERFTVDSGNLERFYPHAFSPARRARMRCSITYPPLYQAGNPQYGPRLITLGVRAYF
jgi:hypothetical protein